MLLKAFDMNVVCRDLNKKLFIFQVYNREEDDLYVVLFFLFWAYHDNPTKYFAKIKLEDNKDFIKLRKK